MTKLLMVFIAVFVAVLGDTTDEQTRIDTIQKGGNSLKTCETKLGFQIPYILYHKGYKKVKYLETRTKDLIGDVMLCVYNQMGIMTGNGDLIEEKVTRYYENILAENNNYILKKNTTVEVYSRSGLIKKILDTCKPYFYLPGNRKVFDYEFCTHTEIFTKYAVFYI
ncbi:uncharacterized protein LOC114348597 isoform X1 [Diabrotica virgifera virgifera]|uniref:Uncharacterized protein n=1 Tax=Diabrotica virgifera virgifera TaxID=50390 RepID=A0ABM5J018_DIAVI|nr:uncharacterized protein LOC114348597 isoform X1 [Diabrotica virgifera virgifera]